MSYEMLVGLHVLDDDMYQQYRDAMRPILSSYGGGFGYDFKVSEVLRPEENSDINRVFTIYFSDGAAKEAFFANPEYLKVREHYFEASVASTTIIASYEKSV
ncbi:DUF1330 domain-containing protein [Agarivorans sp. 1_MG-2023]|uniref:DUF1330 domain-containing protein n=1 Tax=Agarivorans sp. 1_MG-2023 TaxID=3062634 RepID=UPI0026E1E954|nr:DUF1330 domain-containing protein [Agarivorans sp. 1_MG-2023]MDO6763626.1 DUF1330 domain-containing protein [Agarivorans sp. 1_MG-2023]